jgi:predicted peptidase
MFADTFASTTRGGCSDGDQTESSHGGGDVTMSSRHVPILIAVAVVLAGCNPDRAADTTVTDAGTTTTVVETSTTAQSTDSTVEVEDPIAASGLTANYTGDTDAAQGYYEYLPPGYGDGGPSPLLVALHGFGATGNGSPDELDNLFLESGIEAAIPALIRDGRWPADLPFVVLAPQHPFPVSNDIYLPCEEEPHEEPYPVTCFFGAQAENGHPADGSNCATPSEIYEFIAYAVGAYDVDPDRVYLTGLSCGGFAAWEYVAEHSGSQIAAMIPIAGDGRFAWGKAGCDLGDVAIWAFHGDVDDAVNPAGASEPIANLTDCPSTQDAEVTIYQGVDHISWTRTYDLTAGHDIYTWLLEHSRSR